MKINPNLEKDLDAVVISELNKRFYQQSKPMGFEETIQQIESFNRQIVEAHQAKTIDIILPAIFAGFLQLKENGMLFFSEHDLRTDLFEQYLDCKSRFDVLFAASLNSFTSYDIVSPIAKKTQLFEEKYEHIKIIQGLLQDVKTIQQKLEQFDVIPPRDEDEAINFLKNIAPLRTTLQQIEARIVELKDDPYTAEPVRHLQQAMSVTSKLISDHDKKASKFLMDLATAVFEKYQAMPPVISNIDAMIRQKEILGRYAVLFETIGDHTRKEKLIGFTTTIDTTIQKLQDDITKQKQIESVQLEKLNIEADRAYQDFLEIRQAYSEGKIVSDSDKKQASSKLKKAIYVLKSQGQRVRSREIERFMNATGIDKKKKTPKYGSLPEPNLFYKKAFFVLLPINIILVIIILLIVL